MYVPVVTATGFECDIGELDLLCRYWGEIAVADEILGVGCVRLANGENHLLLEALLLRCGLCLIGPHILCHTERSPRVGPSGIERTLREKCNYFLASNAVFLS